MVVNSWAEPEAMRASPLFTMSPALESFRLGVVFGLSVLDGVVRAAAACLYKRRVAWFGGVFGLSILDDLVHAAAACLYVRRVAWFGGVRLIKRQRQ